MLCFLSSLERGVMVTKTTLQSPLLPSSPASREVPSDGTIEKTSLVAHSAMQMHSKEPKRLAMRSFTNPGGGTVGGVFYMVGDPGSLVRFTHDVTGVPKLTSTQYATIGSTSIASVATGAGAMITGAHAGAAAERIGDVHGALASRTAQVRGAAEISAGATFTLGGRIAAIFPHLMPAAVSGALATVGAGLYSFVYAAMGVQFGLILDSVRSFRDEFYTAIEGKEDRNKAGADHLRSKLLLTKGEVRRTAMDAVSAFDPDGSILSLEEERLYLKALCVLKEGQDLNDAEIPEEVIDEIKHLQDVSEIDVAEAVDEAVAAMIEKDSARRFYTRELRAIALEALSKKAALKHVVFERAAGPQTKKLILEKAEDSKIVSHAEKAMTFNTVLYSAMVAGCVIGVAAMVVGTMVFAGVAAPHLVLAMSALFLATAVVMTPIDAHFFLETLKGSKQKPWEKALMVALSLAIIGTSVAALAMGGPLTTLIVLSTLTAIYSGLLAMSAYQMWLANERKAQERQVAQHVAGGGI